jgi:hypothetical protein
MGVLVVGKGRGMVELVQEVTWSSHSLFSADVTVDTTI